MRRIAAVLCAALMAAGATACTYDSGDDDGDADVTAMLAELQAETDAVVQEALTRNGLQSFEPPAPGLGETYVRAPRRHANVYRHYQAYQRVDAALTPTIHATMTQIADRIRLDASLARRDSMAYDLEVSTAILNRRRELELRKMLADEAVTLYETPEPAAIASRPRIETQAERDSISRARRALTPEQRARVNEGLDRARDRSAATMQRGAEIVADSRERLINQHLGLIGRFQAELDQILARRAAGRFSPRDADE